MIFAWKVGSTGSGEQSFTIRVPINVSPWSRITTTLGDDLLNVAGHPARIFEEVGYYILEVYGFATEEEAHGTLPGVHAGLVWAALSHGIALLFPGQTAPVSYRETPELVVSDLTRQFLDKGWDRLDGHYPGDRTVIKPEHRRLYADYLGSIKVISSTVRDEDIAGRLSEAMGFPHPRKAIEEEKLRLAYNIYSSSFFQVDNNARLLALVTVLESLNPNRSVPQQIEDTVESFESQVRELRDATDADSGRDDYNSLLRRLELLKKESIRQGSLAQKVPRWCNLLGEGSLKPRRVGEGPYFLCKARQGIRFLVTDALQSDPEVRDPESVGREARDLYDLRSSLVHNGRISENEARAGVQRLMYIVPKVLRVMFAEAAGREAE